MSAAVNQQVLPPKEANLFKTILSHYERKQYKKGIKACDDILKKFPENGETMSMKGLLFNCQNKKEEAFDLVKKGLRFNMQSHVCWHVFGLLHRSDKNYTEAMKCYKNALRHDKENLTILRDLSLLQIQMRDLEGFKDTRNQVLSIKPGQRPSWIGLGLAKHLLGDPYAAFTIINTFDKTQAGIAADIESQTERSELIMYKVQLLEEAGKLQDALDLLDANRDQICDRVDWKESKARLLIKLNRVDEAEKFYWRLLEDNADNLNFFLGLEKCAELKANGQLSTEDRLVIYEKSLEKFPFASLAKIRPVFIAEGEKFQSLVTVYIQNGLRKGVPSLFSSLGQLYKQPTKAAYVEQLLEKWLPNLRTRNSFEADGAVEPASTLMWALFFGAQHHDFHRQSAKALTLIDEALTHTPTNVDLYMCKARIYKHGGNPVKAAELMNEARELDTADRYVNSKCTKYLLYADEQKRAEDTIGLFTREGVDQASNLVEMQCQWYELASGLSHMRKGDFGKALKRFVSIDSHYTQFTEDQFDFHTYCWRKMTLRAYSRLLRSDSQVRGHRFYFKAACAAVKCYLELFDHPPGTPSAEQEASMDGLSEGEKKKMLSKLRRAEKRQQEEAAKTAEAAKHVDPHKKKAKTEDPDPEGVALANSKDPLGEAQKFVNHLKRVAGDRTEVHFLAFDVAIRKQKVLLMLQALKHLHALDNHHAGYLQRLVQFLKFLETNTNSNADINNVVRAELASLVANRTSDQVVEELLQSASVSLAQRLIAAKHIAPINKDRALALFADVTIAPHDLSVAVDVHKLLTSLKKERAESFKEQARSVFPLSVYFL